MSWDRIRWTVLERDDHTCRYCGRIATHVDHIIPRSAGGSDHLWNLVAACQFCNCSKGAKVFPWALRWRSQVERVDADAEAAYEMAVAEDAAYEAYLNECDRVAC
jgi:5-methylcytosine-specific restriction endonuclease McrA